MDTTLDCCNESVNGGRHFYECGCTLYLSTMLLVHCPLHAAAKEMRGLLAKLIASAARMQSKSRSFSTIGAAEYLDLYTNAEDARALLAKVGG